MKLFEKNNSLLVWSWFLALMAGLLLRFLHVQVTALLLKAYSTGFNLQVFRITYQNTGGGTWTDGRVFMVYIFATMLFLFLGLILVNTLEKNRIRNVKVRLFLTWLAFFSVFLLPLQLLAAVFVVDELGFGLKWFIPEWPARLVVALACVGIGLIFRKFWIRLFIRTAPALDAINEYGKRRRFIRVVLLYALLPAAAVTAMFAVSAGTATWLLVNLFQLLVVVAFAVPALRLKTPRIIKTTDTYYLPPLVFIAMIAAITLVFLLNLFWLPN